MAKRSHKCTPSEQLVMQVTRKDQHYAVVLSFPHPLNPDQGMHNTPYGIMLYVYTTEMALDFYGKFFNPFEVIRTVYRDWNTISGLDIYNVADELIDSAIEYREYNRWKRDNLFS